MTQAKIDALTTFRVTLHDPLDIHARWDPSSPSAPCSWHGILCSLSSSPPRVIVLCLSGPISDHLAIGLPFLPKLNLHHNSFSRPILTSLSHLLSLFLQFNSLTKPLPPSLLTNLSDLQVFSTIGNFLTGGIPTTLPSSFRFLDLSSNTLAGPLLNNLSTTAPASSSSIFPSTTSTTPCSPPLPTSIPSYTSSLTGTTLRAPSPLSSPIAPPSSISASRAMTFRASFSPPS